MGTDLYLVQTGVFIIIETAGITLLLFRQGGITGRIEDSYSINLVLFGLNGTDFISVNGLKMPVMSLSCNRGAGEINIHRVFVLFVGHPFGRLSPAHQRKCQLAHFRIFI